jgi:hypothetical protein
MKLPLVIYRVKPRSYIILAAVLLAAIFLLWPRARTRHEPLQPEGEPPPSTIGRPGPRSSEELPRLESADDTRARLLAPEAATIAVTPESPPEQSVAWRIARQEAMLKVLQRHLESSEAKWRTSTDATELETLQSQIEILRTELTNQQAELRRLQELPSTNPTPVPPR